MSKKRRPAAKKGEVSNPVRARARARPVPERATAPEATPKNAGGRPSSYSPEIAEAICNHITDGRSLRSFCQGVGAPNKTTVLRWLKEHEGFREAYQVARTLQADMLVDELLDIADQAQDPNRGRLRIDARKWIAARLAPKKYGDKTEIDGRLQLEVTPEPKAPSKEVGQSWAARYRKGLKGHASATA